MSEYSQYTDLANFPNLMIEYLMDNNEMIWKLLKYNESDAWSQSDLSKTQKSELIYNGSGEMSDYRVFMDIGQSDVWNHEICVIKMAIHGIIPEHRVVGTLDMAFGVYSHYKINTLSNYKTRTDVIAEEFLKTFNGADIGGIGNMFFSRMGSTGDRMINGGIIPFSGKWIVISNKIA